MALCAMAALLAAPAVRAQDTAAVEAAHRRAVLDVLPPLAAQRVFGLEANPAPGPATPIGSYSKGCLAGAVELPADGPHWQVMRPSRNRAWGHPMLIGLLQRLADQAAADWRGLLVGDIGQPRGGPMLTGHESHQIGLDADIWLTMMPDRRLSREERDNTPAVNLVAANGLDVDPATWRPEHKKLLETAAKLPGVTRIFVNPAIKKALCRDTAGEDRGWLRVIRPWWQHKRHFHMRLRCPAGQPQCHDQPPPPPGDGCGALAWWFTPEGLHPKPGRPHRPLMLSDLPAACAAVAR
ncbi:MAG: penicillin-insensitive murein endopeptidase [Thiohalocapsa sp.]